MKGFFAIVVAVAMLSAVLAGCSSDGAVTPADTTAKGGNTEVTASYATNYVEPINEDLANLDYGGEQFVILHRGPLYGYWEGNELFAEELTSEPIKDSIYNRNMMIEELLGVELAEVDAPGYEVIQQKVRTMVGAGDDTYDIVAASAAYGPQLIREGNVYDLYSNGIDTYLDTTKPWWPQYWIKEAEIADRLYCIAGGPGMSLYKLMVVSYYNKDMAAANGVEDLYTVVEEGRWTLDYVAELAADIYRDVNGSSTRDAEDEFGVAIDNYDNTDIFWSGFNMRLVSRDEDGSLVFDNTHGEKIFNAAEKIFSLVYENPGATFYNYQPGSWVPMHTSLFAGGNVMITFLHLQKAEEAALRNMQDEYGILPTPKYDEKQKEYYTYVHDQYSIFMVPITVKDPVMSGAVLEAMAYETYRSVVPAYFDVALKGRYANDPQSREMIDMISGNILMDTAVIYGSVLDYPAANIIRANILGGKKSYAGTYEKYARILPVVLRDFENKIRALEN
ncbi:MAG: hypothetical protein IKV54_03720 [Clostridia bacterium]|nr:hypothetical protein [Clostridia bacterium]